jgi:hypothetical protein
MRSWNDVDAAPEYRLSWRDRVDPRLRWLVGLPWAKIVLAVVLAWLLAGQIINPNTRVIKATAGVVLFIVAYRAKPLYALSLIAILWAVPFALFIGESTVVLIGLVTLVYLARLILHQADPIARTPVDAGVGALAACYVLSFYNIENPAFIFPAVQKVFGVLGSFILFYFTASFIRNEADLRRFVRALSLTLTLSVAVGLFELFVPGRPLIPGWILANRTDELLRSGVRVAGPFQDYELFGEFMAVGTFLAIFVAVRARSPNERFYGAALSVATVAMLLATVTRGAVIVFVAGGAYLLWSIRKSLKIRDFVSIMLVSAAVLAIMEFALTNFTRAGSIIDRLMGTYFVGFVPDTRGGWAGIWERAMLHPWVGAGPHYDLGMSGGLTGKGLHTYLWPHNQYLYYVHTVGLLGASAFLFIALRLLYLSGRNKGRGLRGASYAKSLMVVLHVMFAAFLLDQYKIDYLRNPSYQYFPWLLMGLIAATYRIIKTEEAASRASP